jgi:hypothetical protein
LFLKIVYIFKNRGYRKQQKYVYLTKLITYDKITLFDGRL